MKNLIITVAVVFCLSSGAIADDLYKVTLHSHRQAEALEAMDSRVLMQVTGGYLVLVGDNQSEVFDSSNFDAALLATGIKRDQLAVDGRFDRKNADKFEILYEDGRVRLLLAGSDRLALAGERVEVFPLPQVHVDIAYKPSSSVSPRDVSAALGDDLTDLMDQVQQANLESYVHRLQAFTHRLTGTDSNYAARDWIESKFVEFGYDSISIDPFIGSQLWNRVPCQSYNVIAHKPGTVYPDQHIILGGHFDAVPDCPGADDNASGTATVLEIARILKNVDTRMSFTFIAFDSEESWLWGSTHYAEGAVARNEDIVLMINPDMIGHWDNDARADLYTGQETAYASLWSQIATNYLGIVGDLSGATASDHWPFQQAGYDVIFVQEKVFSTEYHQPSDSTTYMNFEYMTRMVKATLATLYTVDRYPPPIRLTSVQEPGDGQSQIVNWPDCSAKPLDFLRLSYYPTTAPGLVTSIDLPISETSYTVNGLTEGVTYGFKVQAYDYEGYTSFAYDPLYGTPSSVPATPRNVMAMPVHDGIQLTWNFTNTELDFSHCSIVRDGEVIATTPDTSFRDEDPSLGSDLHYYYVTAVDTDDNHSDTVGTEPFWSKTAALTPGKILAVNRSNISSVDFVDEVETGVFMREALDGYDFDYFSDTVATVCGINCGDVLDLNEMVDYGVLIVGDEMARFDNIGNDPQFNGILDTVAYYLSIGGRVLIFGRWGDLVDYNHSIDYLSNGVTWDDAYHDYFHIDSRVQTTTIWPTFSTVLTSDMVGARSEDSDYPYLAWDSLATLDHANANNPTITEVAGIPCASYAVLGSATPEVFYSYDSRGDDPYTEGQPVAWRYLEDDYRYVWFEIPLSFFDRTTAITVFRRALDELMDDSTPVEQDTPDRDIPESFALRQNYPNPFNPTTEIIYTLPQKCHVRLSVYNVLGQHITTLVDAQRSAGTHTVQWDGDDSRDNPVATGIYFYRLSSGNITVSRKMLLLK